MSTALRRPVRSPGEIYGDALRRPGTRLHARFSDGSSGPVALDRWIGPATAEECAVLDHAVGPVLDVGCGAGRHVIELQRRGVPALGIDVVAHAVSIARGRGAEVLHRSVFAAVPQEGSWATALLLDGNIGIGGDPVGLLRRVAALLGARGSALVEVEPDCPAAGPCRVRVESSAGVSHWFPWARLGAQEVPRVAAAAAFTPEAWWTGAGRSFCLLRSTGR